MGWISGWSHRKTVTITGQSGAGTNYQVNLSIGDASGGDFHLENHCTSFPNDITVTDNDQTSLLDHWVEDLTVDPISMWVEVADDLGSNADVCVYYDKSGESSASNIGNTFLLGDNWSDGDYTSNPTWTVSSGTWSAANYYLENTADGWHTIYTAFGVDEGIWEWEFSGLGGDPGNSHQVYFMSDDTSYTNAYLYYDDGSTLYLKKYVGGVVGTLDSLALGTPTSGWHDYKVTRNSSGLMKVYIDGVEKLSATNAEVSGSAYVLLRFYSSGQKIDDFRVRKYNDPEPAFSSAGSEENAPVGAIMNQFQGANIGADLYDGTLIT